MMRRFLLLLVVISIIALSLHPASASRNRANFFWEAELDYLVNALPEGVSSLRPRDNVDLVRRLHLLILEADRDLTSLVQMTEEELEYLLSLQEESGIIAQTPGGNHSVPYFANMAALAMLSHPAGHEPVHRYMEWYLAHVNRPDRFNMPGTIYDYKKVGGAWVPTYDYDSADSYAATFMSLVLAYTQTTEDIGFAAGNLARLVEVAEVLIRLQDRDGLIWVKPGYFVKFLMDNAENYRGLRDAALLMEVLGRDDLASRYNQAAVRVAAGIENRLWLENSQTYAWALYGRWWRRAPKHKWYPDTIAQMYPVVFGVIEPDSQRAQSLYAYLTNLYPNWPQREFDDRFPWTILAYMAALMEDDVRAVAYMENVYEQTAQPKRAYPWHAFEAAFFLKAGRLLGLRHHLPVFLTQEAGEGGEEIALDLLEIAEESPDAEQASEEFGERDSGELGLVNASREGSSDP